MNPWQRGVLVALAIATIAPPRAPAETDGVDCRSLTIRVHDATGLGVPNALVTFDRGWSVPTDQEGRAKLECNAGVRDAISLQVEVTARGYRPAFATISISNRSISNRMSGDNEIYLERDIDDAKTLPVATTVSARELSGEVQNRSASLQEEGILALKRGDYADAEQLFRHALELTPSSSSIYNNIGISYLRRYKFEEATRWLEKAVKIAPYDPHMLGNLGLMRWLQGRYEESYRLLDRAVTGGFSAPAAHFMLGVLLLQKGQVAKSVDELKKSDENKYPMRDLYLSIALHALGKDKAASKTYDEFTRKSPAPLLSAMIPSKLAGDR